MCWCVARRAAFSCVGANAPESLSRFVLVVVLREQRSQRVASPSACVPARAKKLAAAARASDVGLDLDPAGALRGQWYGFSGRRARVRGGGIRGRAAVHVRSTAGGKIRGRSVRVAERYEFLVSSATARCRHARPRHSGCKIGASVHARGESARSSGPR